ncbi:hypothetical protein CLU96_2262 [Chryseobacterium sp. 52]|nr:hypothetical protein CLU96_2262 [Chryseobacterium sp. 52]
MCKFLCITIIGLYTLLYVSCNPKRTEGNFVMPTKKNKGVVENFKKACFFVSSQKEIDSLKKVSKIDIELPTNREIEQVRQITDFIGLPQNFGIYKGNIRNAMAVVINGKRIIIFRKDLLRRIDRAGGSEYWSSMFILAHEIGHHLSNHFSTDSPNSKDTELEADFFAGSVLCRLGASLEETIKPVSFGFLTTSLDHNNHPDKKSRVAMITNAWNSTNFQLNNTFAVPPPPPDDDIDFGTQSIFTQEDFHLMHDDLLNNIIENKSYYELEGIITRIHYNDSRYFNSPNNIQEIQVEITKDNTGFYENKEGGVKIGTRILVQVPTGEEMCHACILNYLSILVRGRKIRFKTYIFGSGLDSYMFYLEKLKR